ncbi:MAG: hypothetical protein R3254_01010 [Thiomicrorhabdus sp.]|nr:hypothetical protein [Thiomicrorhabdus sp.]
MSSVCPCCGKMIGYGERVDITSLHRPVIQGLIDKQTIIDEAKKLKAPDDVDIKGNELLLQDKLFIAGNNQAIDDLIAKIESM